MNTILDYPLVSVVLPAFNAQEYLVEAVDSILEQTFTDFELIIINDGSTDQTFDQLEEIRAKDKRVRVFHRKNQGLVNSLNFAINQSRGKYIARMDADDISLPARFEKQVKLLETNENIDVVGCDYFTINEHGQEKSLVTMPKSDRQIALTLTYSVPVAHPAVMIRKSVFEHVQYEESSVEDYLLWVNLYKPDGFYNLNEPLFKYRHNYGSSFSDSKRLLMIQEEGKVSNLFISKNKPLIFSYLDGALDGDASLVGRALFAIYSRFSKQEALKFLIKKPLIIPYFTFHAFRHFARVLYRVI